MCVVCCVLCVCVCVCVHERRSLQRAASTLLRAQHARAHLACRASTSASPSDGCCSSLRAASSTTPTAGEKTNRFPAREPSTSDGGDLFCEPPRCNIRKNVSMHKPQHEVIKTSSPELLMDTGGAPVLLPLSLSVSLCFFLRWARTRSWSWERPRAVARRPVAAIWAAAGRRHGAPRGVCVRVCVTDRQTAG